MSGDEFDELKWREVNRAELAGTVYGDDLPPLERRDLVVSGALPRHQMRSYLKAAHKAFEIVEWQEQPHDDLSIFRIACTDAQWEKINEWVEQTKVER